ncbi:uncharacterized protein LOC107424091 isoform X2 [Ziziphus jujuba]|uniref:Uncharacterized protein LOC107424091 isoform X2 n=2 Tax=Ziziphus jujuba TaxID=326968 RepID=A0A6P6GFR7_ZIZJJ|nr:uncharacterized protein LOC107424091 isoform X2 [Ziziphus jujuba var. spinosa]XP_060674761.1 uncharacterized protein LOC107424091 isoform X2 [Ziziphus jujuba]KAH7519270.1 hypothetical protein FEM48_Zijuj08G0018200 [Ziziphus jujuba var. spinosa]
MDPVSFNSDSDAPKKRKFKPKPPPRRVPKPEVKAEVVEDVDDAKQARDLLKRFNEGLMRTKPKVEKKVAATQIAFGYGGASATLKSYGVPRGANDNRLQGSASASNGSTFPLGTREEKEYREPWDYYSYYPVTLPHRKPYSGNPELLNAEEFWADSEIITYNESSTKVAEELDLMEEIPETSMFFVQLPPTIPSIKQSNIADSKEATESSQPPGSASNKQKSRALGELPEGFMGKMLVYRSGAIKLKLGDTLYDVSSGMDCGFAQDVVAINNAEKHCCIIGELNKRIILTPDVDSILSRMADL